MRVLLDTNAFLWAVGAPENLSPRVRDVLAAPATIWVLSVVSVWEMQVKASLGKLDLRIAVQDLVAQEQQENGMELLPLMLRHVLAIESLPPRFGDPFDRALTAQAVEEGLPFVTVNPSVESLGVARIW